MTARLKTPHLLVLLAFFAFILFVWLAHRSGLAARQSASQAYTFWLKGSQNAGQTKAAMGQNWLWAIGTVLSLVLAILCLSKSVPSRQTSIRRTGFGLMLLVGSGVPISFAFTIVGPLLNLGGRLSPGASVTSMSTGGITLHGWQMYGAAALLVFVGCLMITRGIGFLRTPPNE